MQSTIAIIRASPYNSTAIKHSKKKNPTVNDIAKMANIRKNVENFGFKNEIKLTIQQDLLIMIYGKSVRVRENLNERLLFRNGNGNVYLYGSIILLFCDVFKNPIYLPENDAKMVTDVLLDASERRNFIRNSEIKTDKQKYIDKLKSNPNPTIVDICKTMYDMEFGYYKCKDSDMELLLQYIKNIQESDVKISWTFFNSIFINMSIYTSLIHWDIVFELLKFHVPYGDTSGINPYEYLKFTRDESINYYEYILNKLNFVLTEKSKEKYQYQILYLQDLPNIINV